MTAKCWRQGIGSYFQWLPQWLLLNIHLYPSPFEAKNNCYSLNSAKSRYGTLSLSKHYLLAVEFIHFLRVERPLNFVFRSTSQLDSLTTLPRGVGVRYSRARGRGGAASWRSFPLGCLTTWRRNSVIEWEPDSHPPRLWRDCRLESWALH